MSLMHQSYNPLYFVNKSLFFFFLRGERVARRMYSSRNGLRNARVKFVSMHRTGGPWVTCMRCCCLRQREREMPKGTWEDVARGHGDLLSRAIVILLHLGERTQVNEPANETIFTSLKKKKVSFDRLYEEIYTIARVVKTYILQPTFNA